MITKPSFRRKRHGIYIHPLIILIAVLAAGAAGLTWYLRSAPFGSQEGQPSGSGGTAAPVQANAPPDTPPEHITTPSGIACTLTRLPENAIYAGNLILVNNWTEFHFPENQKDNLVCVLDERTDSYYARDNSLYLLPEAQAALNDFMDAYVEQGGKKSIQIVAAHRTVEYQQHLFDQSAERNGLEHAKRYVAQPGFSEHHTGLTVDLGTMSGDFMDSVGDYAWITENCQDYGWIVRYETGKEEITGIWDEPWHFRYVGIPHATEMARLDYCLEEYIDYLKIFPQDAAHLIINCVSGSYEVWYAEGTSVYLPDSTPCSVSGNNIDGFIVTCKTG
ncbi:MAG: M15 family metallopeptidase [Oscillospiraceae bacterium]|nr:M15 family metallopeptidase [Oscillospiraceae bacterium]